MDALWSEGGQQKLIKNLEEELEKIAAGRNDASESNVVTPQSSDRKTLMPATKQELNTGLKVSKMQSMRLDSALVELDISCVIIFSWGS